MAMATLCSAGCMEKTELIINLVLILAAINPAMSTNSRRRWERSAFERCEDYGAKMCFSCASEDARADWSSGYESVLNRPGNFSSLCDDLKEGQQRIHVVGCMSSCVTLVEPQFVFGMRVRQRYFRGCLDTMFASSHGKRVVQKLIPGSNSLRGEHCRLVARNDLFNNAGLRPDNLTLCLCGCDRCNVYPDLLGQLYSGAATAFDQPYPYLGLIWVWVIGLGIISRFATL